MTPEQTAKTNARVETLFDRTNAAYSFDAYGERGWRGCIRMLIRHGLTDDQIETVLCSKWTRWAGDHASNHNKRYGRFTGRDLERFMDTARGCGWADVVELTAEAKLGEV